MQNLFLYAKAEQGNDRQPESFSGHYTDRPGSYSQIFNPGGEYTGASTSVDPGVNLLGTSFDTQPYSASHVDEPSFQIRQKDSVLAISQHAPPRDHISQPSAVIRISGQRGGNKLVAAHPELPVQCEGQVKYHVTSQLTRAVYDFLHVSCRQSEEALWAIMCNFRVSHPHCSKVDRSKL